MRIFTIGFTKTSAEHFFARLNSARAKRIIDVRLNNVSQLAGFAKRDDLKYFSRQLCSMDYRHVPELAPTEEMLTDYRKNSCGWDVYQARFQQLIEARRIETMDRSLFEGGCLLCSEDQPHHCHRRTVAEYLQDRWGNVEIVHL